MLKAVFWGYDKSAESKMRVLLSEPDVRVVAVIVPVDRSEETVLPIRRMAREAGIQVLAPTKLKDPVLREALGRLVPDFHLVDSYSRLIPPGLLSLAPLGGFNFHPGKLPEYRGAHVLNWAIINGEPSLTLTLHRMDDAFDHGDIIAERAIPIPPLGDVNSIFRDVIAAGEGMLRDLLKGLLLGPVRGRPQGEAGARHFKARRPEDGRIDWRAESGQIYNLVRALLPPWPCAFFLHQGSPVRVLEAYPLELAHREAPGKVLAASKDAFSVAAGRGALLIRAADRMDFDPGKMLE